MQVVGWGGSLVAVLGILLSAGTLRAQPFSPYSAFEALDDAELATLQAKLTYVGVQLKAHPSVLFVESSSEADLSAFGPFERPGINYSNDDATPRVLKLSVTQLRSLVEAVGTIPGVVAGGAAASPFLSFALHATAPGAIAFEAVLDETTTAVLFGVVRTALSDAPDALNVVNAIGCGIGATEAGVGVDVSADTSVKFSGVRRKLGADTFVGTVNVTNDGASAIDGPVSVVFGLPATVTIVRFDGNTCKIAPAGRKFINLPLSGGALPPGASVEAELELANPDRELIEADIQIVAGAGSR